MKHLWRHLKVDLNTLNKIQINTALLHHSNEASNNLFRGLEYCTIMSNNCYELISTKQQGRVLTLVKEECIKLISELGIDPSSLGR